MLADFPAGSVPLILTSPPYDDMRDYGGHGFCFESMAEQIARVLEPGGYVCWVVQNKVLDNGSLSMSAEWQTTHFVKTLGLALYDTIVLEKKGSKAFKRYRYGPPEYCYVFTKGEPRRVPLLRDKPNKMAGKTRTYTDRNSDGSYRKGKPFIVKPWGYRPAVWRYSEGGFTTTRDEFAWKHPALMGEAVARDLIRAWSRPGDLVLDPMAGAGTTLKCALIAGRNFCGVEIHEPYFRIALDRIESGRREAVMKLL